MCKKLKLHCVRPNLREETTTTCQSSASSKIKQTRSPMITSRITIIFFLCFWNWICMKRGVYQRRHGRFFSPYPLVIHHPLTVSSLYVNQEALDRQRGRWGTPAGTTSNSRSLQGALKLSFNSLSHEADDVLRPLSRTGVIPTGNHLTAPL